MKFSSIFKLLCLGIIFIIPFSGWSQVVTTVAGITEVAGEQDGRALGEATFNNPHGIATDSRGMVYIADRWNHKIRRLDTERGMVVTMAGDGDIGNTNGNGANARFYSPWGIAADSLGNIYIADTKNHMVRKMDTAGNVTTLAGSGSPGVVDGPGQVARFSDPTGIACQPDGTVYVCDHLGHTIRKISPLGIVTTIAGQANLPGFTDGAGTGATFNRPYGLEIDHLGNIFVADEFNHAIRMVTPAGVVTTFAGDGILGSRDGPKDEARFNYPYDVVIGKDNVVFVMDGANRVVRKVDVDGLVTTFAGEAGVGGGVDGVGIQAKFGAATAITMDHRNGDLYVGDAYNHLIRKITQQATIEADAFPVEPGDSVCLGSETPFTAQPQIFLAYNYLVNGQLVQSSTSPDFTQMWTDTGAVEVIVVGIEPDGTEIRSKAFNLYVSQVPIADFTFTPEGVSRDGFTIKFEQDAPFANNFYWIFGDTLSGNDNYSTDPNPTHTYSEYGLYSVTLIASNGPGCQDSVTKVDLIQFEDNPANIFIPNAFTPNGDGLNDVLYIRGNQIETIDFMIFNQWGQMIFHTEDPKEGWDGTFNGKPVQPDTYIFAAKVTLITGIEHQVSGQTTVLR